MSNDLEIGVKELLGIIMSTYHGDIEFRKEFLEGLKASSVNLATLCEKIVT